MVIGGISMAETDLNSKFWIHVANKVDKIPGGKRYTENLRKKCLESEYMGEEVIKLEEGPAYQKALEMVAADVELMYLRDKLLRAEERRKLKEKEFFLYILEETDLDEDMKLSFDPVAVTVRKRTKRKEDSPDSYKATLNGFKTLIEEAISNPLPALRMADDETLPDWLREMARVITTGSLKPNLRRAIEECIEDPGLAKRWHNVAIKEEMPHWFIEMTHILGARNKWKS
jgi:hypothetical protein